MPTPPWIARPTPATFRRNDSPTCAWPEPAGSAGPGPAPPGENLRRHSPSFAVRKSCARVVSASRHASDSDDTTTASTNTAPTGAPTITGTAQVGQTLTAATTGITDADGLTSPTYTYQWIRVDGTEADIAAANSSTYILVAADLGTTLKVRVTFADDLGHTETLTSAATATVTATPAVPTREPFEVDIVGVPEVAVAGESYELTAQSDEDSLVYAWRVDSGAIEPDDVQMVVWTAPETAGVAWIHVDVTREDDVTAGHSAYVRVEVPEPEPEPEPEPVPADKPPILSPPGAPWRSLPTRPRKSTGRPTSSS